MGNGSRFNKQIIINILQKHAQFVISAINKEIFYIPMTYTIASFRILVSITVSLLLYDSRMLRSYIFRISAAISGKDLTVIQHVCIAHEPDKP